MWPQREAKTDPSASSDYSTDSSPNPALVPERMRRNGDGSELDTAQTLLRFKAGGFPEKRHYDDEEAETDGPFSSNDSTDSGSTAPLVREVVERRHKEVGNGHRSKHDTAQILKAGGVPETGHYDDDEAKTDPPSSNLSAVSVSPPLVPEVEQRRREKRNRYRSKLGKAKTFQTAEGTRLDPRLQPRVSLQQSSSFPGGRPNSAQHTVLSTNKAEEMHDNPINTSREETAADAKQRTKRKDEDPSPSRETTIQSQVEVGLGFFSKLQDSGRCGQVVGNTGAKKKRKKAISRRRKPKPDPLEGVGMGFFSGQLSEERGAEGETREISDRLEPLYVDQLA